jgi:hypothetical protein
MIIFNLHSGEKLMVRADDIRHAFTIKADGLELTRIEMAYGEKFDVTETIEEVRRQIHNRTY